MKTLIYAPASVVAAAMQLMPTPAVSGYIETTICVSGDPNNNGCPINANAVSCGFDPGGIAKSVCVITKPDGTKQPLPYIITEGPHGNGGSCGWRMLHLTCIAP